VATYYDSSAILEVLLGGAQRRAVIRCWGADRLRVSSILLEAESLTVLRRVAFDAGLAPGAPAIKKRLDALDDYLGGLVVREVDWDVIEIMRNTAELGNCRSLDALHLGTAILIQQHLDEPLNICTLDRRMRQAASALGFPILP